VPPGAAGRRGLAEADCGKTHSTLPQPAAQRHGQGKTHSQGLLKPNNTSKKPKAQRTD